MRNAAAILSVPLLLSTGLAAFAYDQQSPLKELFLQRGRVYCSPESLRDMPAGFAVICAGSTEGGARQQRIAVATDDVLLLDGFRLAVRFGPLEEQVSLLQLDRTPDGRGLLDGLLAATPAGSPVNVRLGYTSAGQYRVAEYDIAAGSPAFSVMKLQSRDGEVRIAVDGKEYAPAKVEPIDRSVATMDFLSKPTPAFLARLKQPKVPAASRKAGRKKTSAGPPKRQPAARQVR